MALARCLRPGFLRNVESFEDVPSCYKNTCRAAQFGIGSQPTSSFLLERSEATGLRRLMCLWRHM